MDSIFLGSMVFETREDENKEKTTFIRVDGAIVEVLKDTQTIKSFFTNYLTERQKKDGVRKIPTRLINTLITSQKLSEGTLNFIHERKLQFLILRNTHKTSISAPVLIELPLIK